MNKPNTNKKLTNKIQCPVCIGTGFVKYTPIVCKTCDGIKCMFCNSTGLERMPWDLCSNCYGDGEIMSLTNES